MPADDRFFGLGDKTGSFDRRNQAYTLWNTDHGIEESLDPIYKSIPFFLSTSSGRSYGLFLDNTWRTWFDFGKRSRDSYSFGAEGGPLNYYLIYGPTPKQVVEGYIFLTGTPPLPALWSLGFQQSRYSYAPESQLREVANRLRADKIPSDVLYLDIDYQFRNRPFTVDRALPGFPGLVSDLNKQHFKLVVMTDLHVARVAGQGHMPYDTGHAGDHFVKKADAAEFVGIVWPGPAVFPDFTRAQTREWWGDLYKQFVQDGVAGFWNDMNEPAVFNGPGFTMPLDNVHRIDEPGFASRTATHAEIHNILGMENERATYDGLLKLRPNERPFVVTRATFAGGQRYSFTWTGDNSSTWNQLRLGTQQALNLGLSGISFVGDDVGGFGGSPSPDLLTRWIEIGAFKPLYRDHSTKGARCSRKSGFTAPNTRPFAGGTSRLAIGCCPTSIPSPTKPRAQEYRWFVRCSWSSPTTSAASTPNFSSVPPCWWRRSHMVKCLRTTKSPIRPGIGSTSGQARRCHNRHRDPI